MTPVTGQHDDLNSVPNNKNKNKNKIIREKININQPVHFETYLRAPAFFLFH